MVVKAKTAAKGGGRGRRGGGVEEEEEEETMSIWNNSNTGGGGGGGGGMRKGPWTEQEDVHLVWFVRLFGERRWDFLAKVSGLKRTGKSCRLRWVNYLHPGLKRGRITPDEERLILQLHAQWGSRWSRIARKLPGRTDNEIKNYWRTHMRKQVQEGKKRAAALASASPSSPSSTSCSASLNNGTSSTSSAVTEALVQESSSGDEAEEATTAASQHQQPPQDQQEHYHRMDQLWNEIAAAEAATCYAEGWGAGHVVSAEPPASMPSPVWEFCADYSLWRIDDEEYYHKMLDAS